MKVTVLGAGVVGVTTAYCLARHGCPVTVIDRRNELAAEASYANGGQLSYDFASPVDSPGVLRRLADYLLVRPLGIAGPIQPIRGYSITAPAKSGAPQVAIIYLGRKMVFSRIGLNMCIAGFADASPQSPKFAQERRQALVHCAQNTLPQVADYLSISSKWADVRPSTPNSLPIVGESKVRRLFRNIGHGMFGWTLSAASAEGIVREIFCGKGAVIQGKAA